MIDISSTPAFAYLMDIISFIGDFVNSPIWFGISFMQMLIIAFVIHYVIGIALGGVNLRIHGPNSPYAPFDNKGHVRQGWVSDRDRNAGVRETYIGGGRY